MVIKADLLPAISVLSTLALVGLPWGWVWAHLAPPLHGKVVEGELGLLATESYHRFDALAIFSFMGFGVGVVAALGLWFLRGRRGPVILLAGAAGLLIAGWLAMSTGTAFAEGLYPPPSQLKDGALFIKAAVLDTPWAIVAAPTALGVVYGLMAAWNGHEDLGRRLS
ncbi:DUF2567 domain-containing protein [Pseudonocardiaceae bacterium YIM PH 21723]|nr:DUF2567 domain-containing protein [Pseudonocardiaceae bacterium YIM PH 21723]